MAKQVIIAAFEELFGEYVLNMSKENLKIAAVRGKIKLENVQLDGDLIGGFLLGPVGLSGFGVLSCSAKLVKISVPWKNIEKEPTKFEIRGLHLVCVPLIPSTANKMYGAGSSVDPRCTLRTRSKRLVLARFERRYWNGQHPGEGPPTKRIKRAVENLERDWKRRKSRKKGTSTAMHKMADVDEMSEAIEDMFDGFIDSDAEEKNSKDDIGLVSPNDLPELPRDWKVKLREKVMRNMEASLHDIHIRCEVSEIDQFDSRKHTNYSYFDEKPAEERTFALGFTIESVVIRTANEQWKVGSYEKRNPVDGSAMSSEQDYLGANPYVVKNNKIGFFNKLSMYWDDEPPILLADTDVLQGNYRKLSAEKLQARIAAAMEAMFYKQEPGKSIRQSLGSVPPLFGRESSHQFVVQSLDAEIRLRTSDRTIPGPISCSADVLPFNFTFNIRPHQYLQYQRLQAAMKSQQRFDTMLRQRPNVSPTKNPRAWWQYAIACVTSRPNSRPWEDVIRIVQNRKRYIELVVRKNTSSSEGLGYHGGLSDADSAELVRLEDLLPIEALLAFHLLALRQVYEAQKQSENAHEGKSSPNTSSAPNTRQKGKSGRFWKLKGGQDSGKKRLLNPPSTFNDLRKLPPGNQVPMDQKMSSRKVADVNDVNSSITLLEAMTLRLGKKVWFVNWKLHDATVNVVLLRSDDLPIAQLVLRSSGSVRVFGRRKRDVFFDITQCELIHQGNKVLSVHAPDYVAVLDDEWGTIGKEKVVNHSLSSRSVLGPDMVTSSNFLPFPPPGVVCRLASGIQTGEKKLSIAAHPATLVWTTSLFDGLSEFFATQSSGQAADVRLHIRNAATPLARKAQLALLSPASMALYLNIAAPKIWVPIGSKGFHGALFFDAGTTTISGVKDEGETEMNWDVRARDIQVNYIRSRSMAPMTPFDDEVQLYLLSQQKDVTGQTNASSVVQPFHVSVKAFNRVIDCDAPSKVDGMPLLAGTVRSIEVTVSPICLNLVDAEVLARVIGNWYSRGIHLVRRRVSSSRTESVEEPAKVGGSTLPKSENTDVDKIEEGSLPRLFSVTVEKVEMALEGHSKAASVFSDERSFASLETSYEVAPPTRTYLVEVFKIGIRRTHHKQVARTRFSVLDASIVRLRDGSSYSPLKKCREPQESQYNILVRAPHPSPLATENNKTIINNEKLGEDSQTEILRASLLHDGTAHLDEVEIDIESVILRVTPTTLKDCAKAFRRIAELAQLTTKEMERKIHEEGRKARYRGREPRDEDHLKRPSSPLMLDATTNSTSSGKIINRTARFDSSIIFKVTLKESTLLAGHPTAEIQRSPFTHNQGTPFAVIQILSNALIMFQSIENPDATGSKTLHVSVDNASSLVNTEFVRVSPAQAPPMIGPTGAEFRVVYATENLGCVVSQDISLDCEGVKSCLTPNDLSIMISVSRTMFERLRAFGSHGPQKNNACVPPTSRQPTRLRPLSSLVRYQKKGTGIATRIRTEIQDFSFVLLRAYKSHFGAPEFLDFNVKQLKGRLEGCVSALSGEFSTTLSVNNFNSEVSSWEYAVEPFPFICSLEQMPNDLTLSISPDCPIQINLTGTLLRDFAEMKFDVLQDRSGGDSEGTILTPSVLSTVGLRRATVANAIKIQNLTGIDLHVIPDSVSFVSESGFVASGTTKTMEAVDDLPKNMNSDRPTLCLRIAASAVQRIGGRETVFDLPVPTSSTHSARIYLLRPIDSTDSSQPVHTNIGRSTPETVTTDGSRMDLSYYTAEPVVEWCMHNQRLRSSTADVFSLQKGRDLLSSSAWSPGDEVNEDTIDFREYLGQELPVDQDCLEADCIEADNGVIPNLRSFSPEKEKKEHSLAPHKSNWMRPYLKNDSPEWTDMTCTLRMARERVMLPDDNWIWVNDWTVDLSGKLGECTDADGWEYQADFENFTRKRRCYERGDTCRRRRWTRTRMVKPPRLDDPLCQLKFVWETSTDDNGISSIVVRSSVRIKNATSAPLIFFVFSPSWDGDIMAGAAQPGNYVNVPIFLAPAMYLRLAKKSIVQDPTSITDCICSDRVMILPTSYTSSKFVRVSMDLKDVSGTFLHFLLEIKSENGLVDINVEPSLRVINLLPCQLECQLGESIRMGGSRDRDSRRTPRNGTKKIAKSEKLHIASGKEGAFTAVNPWFKPHISLRVPGYRWSPWQRVVNRKANSQTWQPSESEEEWHFSSRDDSDFAEEYKTIVCFERMGKLGDPLILIISVECGHCPTLRVYSQYWIVDKTGFGCQFCEGFSDMLGLVPDSETSRRSHLPFEETKNSNIISDMSIPGHQWAMGMSGMSLYFSKREKLALAIETGIGDGSPTRNAKSTRSKWVSPLDISNVMPKTVFSVDELSGPRRFELALSVTVCPGIFARTKLITLLPRYQIVNLLHRELVIGQDGCLDAKTVIPSQTAVPFHWEKGNLAPKVRLGAPTPRSRRDGNDKMRWTNGRFRVDRIGITSMRIPTDSDFNKVPMVVQAEVRLATKDQSSAVVVVIWSASLNSNPLYVLRNSTSHTIICRQPLQEEHCEPDGNEDSIPNPEGCSNTFECGTEVGPTIISFLGLNQIEEFVWVLKSGDVACFGFDDPEKPHILEWICASNDRPHFDRRCKKAVAGVDAMGSSSFLVLSDGHKIQCQICAEHSTKIIEFSRVGANSRQNASNLGGNEGLNSLRNRRIDIQERIDFEGFAAGNQLDSSDDDEDVAVGLRVDVPALSISVIDNANPQIHGREILLAQFEKIFFAFSQTRQGYHEFEMRLESFQVDNHVQKSIHPVLIFCPHLTGGEPLLHMSAVRRLQPHSNTFVFRYAALRLLEIDIFLDRRTAEIIARFIEPLTTHTEENEEHSDWLENLTISMGRAFATTDRRAPRDIEKLIHSANSGRIYFEQLHLHPVRLGLTFTQEWIEWNPGFESMMVFQFIRGMASIADAPLVFTSFVVGHVFENSQTLLRVISTHYSSQLTKQIFSIVGSLAILGAPADFISNVGTGVRDFFYEPIQGAVHGPRQFIEGLEAGTQSLARGVFVGVTRGAANVTDVVNTNLAGLTTDDDFIDERKAHQRMLTDAMSRGALKRTFGDSLYLAGGSVVRGIKSGALGIVEQPSIYASKHGPVGFVKGVGKAVVGAFIKPVVGVGDAAVLVLNHMSDATSNKKIQPKIPKRLRRGLPSRSMEKPNCVCLTPYNEGAANAQKIVTGGERVDDVYIGHINIPSHLIIGSEQCLWAIDRQTRQPWCVSWEEISHFGRTDGGIRVVVFSQTGLRTYIFHVEDAYQSTELHKLLSMQLNKMGNSSELNSSAELECLNRNHIPGIKSRQVTHIFGSCNNEQKRLSSSIKDEIDLVEQCFERVKAIGSESKLFFKTLDEEAWSLVSSFGQVFSGLSSRRCIVASIINGTGGPIQIKSTKLVEGGSPCYSIPSIEFDPEQGVLHAGGIIIFFGWGVVPNLNQAGNVFMHIETNGFISDLTDHKSRATYAEAMPGYQIGFLEKSYDDTGWWAKYWLLLRTKI